MSRWTHLAGIIRVDNLARLVTPNAPTAEDVIRILNEDPPVGSEGGCLFKFVEWPVAESFAEKDHTNVHSSGLYWGDAIISADLRDVGDVDDEIWKITQWFKDLAGKFWAAKLVMRQAMLEIEVEYKYSRVLSLVDQEENEWVDTTTLKEVTPDPEPEIVKCSCGETFDWENWDRKTIPVPKGVMEAIRHFDMGHTLGGPKEGEE